VPVLVSNPDSFHHSTLNAIIHKHISIKLSEISDIANPSTDADRAEIQASVEKI